MISPFKAVIGDSYKVVEHRLLAEIALQERDTRHRIHRQCRAVGGGDAGRRPAGTEGRDRTRAGRAAGELHVTDSTSLVTRLRTHDTMTA